MKNKILVLGIAALVLAGLLLVTAMQGDSVDIIKPQVFERKFSTTDNKYVPDEIIVKFKPGNSDKVISNINSRHGASVLYTSPFAGFKRLRIPKGKTVSEMVEIYSKNPNVEYAEPNYIAHALVVPNDPLYSYQWHLDNARYGGIRMEEAWDISTGSGVIVAVIDTGVAYENYGRRYKQAPDLAKTCFVLGYDFVNNDNHPNDDNSHGTHVAGTIAQSTNNNIGVAGVAFSACLMPIKVLDKNGNGYYPDVAEGIYFATDNGAHVISMSLGGSFSSDTLENALAYAYGKGVTIVAAAGNEYENGNPAIYPAAYDAYVIAVGATRYDETRAYYSNTGDYVDLTAPGGDIRVDQNGDVYGDGVLQNTFNPNTKNPRDFGYWFFQGTSMATPHVSGVAALILQKNPTWTPADVREALEKTAEDKGASGWDPEYGWGIVDALAAVEYTPTCTSNEDCDDNNECTGDTCDLGTGQCVFTPIANGMSCSLGICCGGICTAPTCTESGNECDDGESCTKDTCNFAGTCDACCSYEVITQCIDGDGCCPEGCVSGNDNDCLSVNQCLNCFKGVCDNKCNPAKEDVNCPDCW